MPAGAAAVGVAAGAVEKGAAAAASATPVPGAPDTTGFTGAAVVGATGAGADETPGVGTVWARSTGGPARRPRARKTPKDKETFLAHAHAVRAWRMRIGSMRMVHAHGS